MSGVVDKVKAKVDQVLHKDKTTHNDPTGPHSSHTANAADPRVGTTGTGHHTGTTGHGTTGGLTGSSTTGGYGSNTHSDPTGPHDSHLANKADPRVDSDRYGAAGNTTGAGGYGTGQSHGTTGGLTGHSTTGGGLTGHSTTGGGLTGHSTTGGYGSTGHSDPTGPHDSHLANKADPRVDSDRYGAAGNTSGAGGYGTGQYGSTGHSTTGHSTTGGGLTGNTHGSDPSGPHDSRLANKLDPRVDSDQYGAAGNTTGAGGYSSTTGGVGHSTGGVGHSTGGIGQSSGGLGHNTRSDPTGPHDSHLANKADPRVDSDRYGAAGNTTGAGGYGTTGHSTTGHGTTGLGGVGSNTGYGNTTGELDHRPNEDGSLPKALTEDHSVAQPHSSLHGNQHSTGTHGTHGTDTYGDSTHKPSLKDKLNPKVDADGDGKAGFMK